MNISRSPQRNTFQVNAHNERRVEEGLGPDEDFMAMWEKWELEDQKQEASPEWQENNLEYDLRSTQWILDKVRASEVYAQNLYAALCNQQFTRLEVMSILKDQRWSCSWRHAGGIIADMREEGDYIDWYCSGIRGGMDLSDAALESTEDTVFVPEGTVTDEIREDLERLGWVAREWEDD
jgi:hypothetical protein